MKRNIKLLKGKRIWIFNEKSLIPTGHFSAMQHNKLKSKRSGNLSIDWIYSERETAWRERTCKTLQRCKIMVSHRGKWNSKLFSRENWFSGIQFKKKFIRKNYFGKKIRVYFSGKFPATVNNSSIQATTWRWSQLLQYLMLIFIHYPNCIEILWTTHL